jgi:hypothetical protein
MVKTIQKGFESNGFDESEESQPTDTFVWSRSDLMFVEKLASRTISESRSDQIQANVRSLRDPKNRKK